MQKGTHRIDILGVLVLFMYVFIMVSASSRDGLAHALSDFNSLKHSIQDKIVNMCPLE